MSKEEHIKEYINNFLEDFLKDATTKGSLDFFRIEIINHNGSLQIDHVFRSRNKIY